MVRLTDFTAESKASGNWSEPEPRYMPWEEDEIAEIAAELYAEETEGDDWFLSLEERGELLRKCEAEAVKRYKASKEEKMNA